jgi:hypothetical protein
MATLVEITLLANVFANIYHFYVTRLILGKVSFYRLTPTSFSKSITLTLM